LCNHNSEITASQKPARSTRRATLFLRLASSAGAGYDAFIDHNLGGAATMLDFNPPPDADFAAMVHQLQDEDADRRQRQSLSPAPRVELQNISHVHEAVMNWMIANPQRSMADCAREFGYTQSWLSTMVHSNLFQARLKEKQDHVFADLAGTLNDKLAAGADIGVTKLIEKLEVSEDPKFIKETTNMMLDKLGFGAATRVAGAGQVNAGPVQNNFYMASPEDLQRARGRIASGAVLPAPDAAPELAPPAEDAP
jgi:hypothetical protein